MTRRARKHSPMHPLAAQRQLGRLFARCNVEIEPAGDPGNFIDLDLRMWNILDAATSGRLDAEFSDAMGLYGNMVTLMADEAGSQAIYQAAQVWNYIVVDVRERFTRTGKWGVDGQQYQALRTGLETMSEWIKRQPSARIARAWAMATEIRAHMLKHGRTSWETTRPQEVLR